MFATNKSYRQPRTQPGPFRFIQWLNETAGGNQNKHTPSTEGHWEHPLPTLASYGKKTDSQFKMDQEQTLNHNSKSGKKI